MYINNKTKRKLKINIAIGQTFILYPESEGNRRVDGKPDFIFVEVEEREE